jgi:hypothetical protein
VSYSFRGTISSARFDPVGLALDEEVIMSASAKFASGEVTSRGLSSTAVLITGYRHEFTRGVLTALGSLILVGILALLVSFGISVLF